MKKYIVVGASFVYDLEQSVNKMLNNGWVPVGGVSTSENSYCQAMMHADYDETKLSYEQERQDD